MLTYFALVYGVKVESNTHVSILISKLYFCKKDIHEIDGF